MPGASHRQHDVDEISPLLSDASSERRGFLGGNDGAASDTDEFQSTKSIWYLILLTISIGGLQIAWSVELSNGSPYLLSLGLSKSLMALVWIAGPLTGTLVQPYVGMLSDNCRVPWGKRKPFMLGGAAATMASLMILAWSKDIVSGLLSLFGADPASQGVKVTVIVFAVIWVYILDFSINTGETMLYATRRKNLEYLLTARRSISASSDPRLHRRLCPSASARGCELDGKQNHRSWKHLWLCRRLHGPTTSDVVAR